MSHTHARVTVCFDCSVILPNSRGKPVVLVWYGTVHGGGDANRKTSSAVDVTIVPPPPAPSTVCVPGTEAEGGGGQARGAVLDAVQNEKVN
jgi:hypothetical protein